jgi:putative drug exporter of the RND superfamily
VALGLVALIGLLVEFNLFVTNMISMIGLAVGIDHSLFIVSRYREERKKGFPKLEAIGAAGATANRAVFFSGLTVVLALLGMFIIPTTIFRALAGGAIVVTIAALAGSMTLLPAILAMAGDRVNWPRLSRRARVDSEHDPKGGFWDRITRGVMARPVVFLTASVLALGGLGSFYFQLNRGTSQNVSQLSDDILSKQAFLTLEREFAGGVTDPARIVITGEIQSASVQAAIQRLREAIANADGFSEETQVIQSEDGTAIEVDGLFRGDPSTEAAFQGIRDLRSEIVPAAFAGVDQVEVLVGGNTAFFADFMELADQYQWVVLALVLGLSFVLLTVVFRSVVVPVTAILMNLLSVAGGLRGRDPRVPGGSWHRDLQRHRLPVPAGRGDRGVVAAVPVLRLVRALHGLSRVPAVQDPRGVRQDRRQHRGRGVRSADHGRHHHRRRADHGRGVHRVRRAGRLGPLQQMGFGLAVAVFMDATIVRTLLVPAAMRLLGDRNWYLPGWLRWLPQVRVEGHEPELETPEEPHVLVGMDAR